MTEKKLIHLEQKIDPKNLDQLFEHNEGVNVSGYACRFDTAWNLETLWGLLFNNHDGVSVIPKDRWNWEEVKGNVPKWGCFFVGIALFDAAFFNISPREAQEMDPQHRMVLECAWESVESAGVDPYSLEDQDKLIGVYIGIGTSDYASLSATKVSLTSSATSVASGRVSYVLGITGTAVSIDTACSSSLVALVFGCRSIESGEEAASLCFGVRAICTSADYVSLSRLGMLSVDGRCKTFDNSANGFVRSEGCGGLFIARCGHMTTASHGRISGHSINQDGKSNGLTAPNGRSQVKLIKEATKTIKGNAYSILEAHGTGTSLGDPIEMQAIVDAIGQIGRTNPLLVASAKTYFGHAEMAAGSLGVLKSIISTKRELIPRHLHFRHLNVHIGPCFLEEAQFSIPNENVVFNSSHILKLIGISSFGFSGTNAHVACAESQFYFLAPH
jgi:acyl transferase domain-containing protein